MAARRPAGSREILAIRGIGKTSNAFRWALIELSDRLELSADYLAATMAIESGFDPAARNPISNASGLVQIMPAQARKMGTSPEAIRAMTAVEQLELVERVFKPHKGRLRTPCDHYLANFLPFFIGKPEATVIARADGSARSVPGWSIGFEKKVYEQNKGFDATRRGFYTVADVCAPVRARVAEAEKKPRIVVTPERVPKGKGGGAGSVVGGFLFGLFAAALLVATKKARLAR